MRKEVATEITLTLLLLLTLFLQPTSATVTGIPNLNTMHVATIDTYESMDPHWAYDTASEQLIMNVYETLIRFPREQVPEDPADFEPNIADSWWISPDGLTYRFHIRQNVAWHTATYGVVTPADVEYSFERGLVMDREGGPMWMLLQPLLGIETTREYDLTDPTQAEQLGQLMDDAVVITDAAGNPDPAGEYVQFNLVMPFAPFMQVLSQPWSSIIDEGWSTAQGAFPGFDDTGYDGWVAWNNPPVSPIDAAGAMMGTGPYQYVLTTAGGDYQLTWFAGYWRGWPAPGTADYVTTVWVWNIPLWTTRRFQFLSDLPATQVDIVYVPRPYIGGVDGMPGVRGVRDLPSLTLDALFFNYDVDPASPFMPTIGEAPAPDLFFDINMRRAFAYSFDYAGYIAEAWLGEAQQPANPIIAGLAYHNPAAPRYNYDLAQAIIEFQAAWGGAVWANGFNASLIYNAGNIEREIAALMLEFAIENLIPWPDGVDVDVIPTPVRWPAMLGNLTSSNLPLWISGWRGDFADPHDFVKPFMHSQGAIAQFQNIQYGQSDLVQQDWPFSDPGAPLNNTYVDLLIEEGIIQADPAIRQDVYNELAEIHYEEVPSVPIAQPLTRHWERDWVQQWYYNLLHGGSHLPHNDDAVFYFYHIWKGIDADASGDGTVDIVDAGVISYYLYWAGGVGPGGYNPVADIFPVSELDGADYLIPGADGWVDLSDVTLINAMWGDP